MSVIPLEDIAASGMSLINSAINKIWPDPADRAKAEVALLQAQAESAVNQMAQEMSVLVAEAKSEHWLAATWRPIVMLTFTALITARWLGWSAPNIGPEEVAQLWSIVQFGLGGYVVGRSAEKIVPQVAQVIAQVLPTKAPQVIVQQAPMGPQGR